MIAFSPGLSWLIVGGWLLAVVLIVAFFMGATRASREHRGVDVLPWIDVRPEDAPPSGGLPPAERPYDYADITWSAPADADVRVGGGVYDAESTGDFDA